MDRDVTLPLPAAGPRERTDTVLAAYDDWFYPFRFDNGAGTSGGSEEVDDIHYTRAEMLFPALDARFAGRWDEVRCLDIACHQGWFSMQTALRGAREVRGLDVRERHIEMASAVLDASRLANVRFEQGSLWDLSPTEDPWELTLCLGLLYHLDDPLGALRLMRALTGRLCAIETQVARPCAPLKCLWGAGSPREGPGVALVEAEPGHVEGDRRLVLVPTLAALEQMLAGVGFARVEICPPPPGAFSQFADSDRVVLLAHVE